MKLRLFSILVFIISIQLLAPAAMKAQPVLGPPASEGEGYKKRPFGPTSSGSPDTGILPPPPPFVPESIPYSSPTTPPVDSGPIKNHPPTNPPVDSGSFGYRPPGDDPVSALPLRPKLDITNLEVAINFDTIEKAGQTTIFTGKESDNGKDYNGDQDLLDNALFLHDPTLGPDAYNFGAAISFPSGTNPQLSGGRIAYAVSEQGQGVDFNGDGDELDDVLFYSLASGSSAGASLLAVTNFILGEELVAFLVNESADGGTDHNGDSDTDDDVLFVHDFSTGTDTNLQLAVQDGIIGLTTRIAVSKNHVAFAVSEKHQGVILNGDIDKVDNVIHIYDHVSGLLQNLGLAVFSIRMNDNMVVFDASEAGQGADFNGDNDSFDAVVHSFIPTTGTIANSALAVYDFLSAALHDFIIAFRVPEMVHGPSDLNADGDNGDYVLHYHDASNSSETNTGWAISKDGLDPEIEGDNILFAVNEASQGNTDQNGDGDSSDYVARLYKISSGSSTNLQTAAKLSPRSFDMDNGFVALTVPEKSQGGQDSNGDGDNIDDVIHLYKIALGGLPQSLGFAITTEFVLGKGFLFFAVEESNQNQSDLNGDGDALDAVIHRHKISAGTTTNLQFAGYSSGEVFPAKSYGNRLAFPVDEASQGSEDQNGDGDNLDRVIFIAK